MAAGGEILSWGEIGKHLMRSDRVEVVGEAIDCLLPVGQAGGQVVTGIELVSPC